MLPDLLKNNHLDEPALSLVKGLENIEQIWIRLKRAFGDSKTMLQKKLEDVKKFGPLWKLKSPDTLQHGLSKLITLLQDILSLSKVHNVQNRLYFGDGLNMTYHIMGDARVTTWLSSIYEENLQEPEKWERFYFLRRN